LFIVSPHSVSVDASPVSLTFPTLPSPESPRLFPFPRRFFCPVSARTRRLVVSCFPQNLCRRTVTTTGSLLLFSLFPTALFPGRSTTSEIYVGPLTEIFKLKDDFPISPPLLGQPLGFYWSLRLLLPSLFWLVLSMAARASPFCTTEGRTGSRVASFEN